MGFLRCASCEDFWFKGVDVNLFSQFQWNVPCQPLSFLIYRLVFALYQIGWNIAIITVWGDPRFYRPVDSKAKWPIYASNWALMFFSLYCFTALITAISLAKRNGGVQATEAIEMEPSKTGKGDVDLDPEEQMKPVSLPWFVKVTWFLQVTSYSVTLFVSVAYWLIDFDPEVEHASIFTIHTHAISSVLVLLDMALVATPCRWTHFFFGTIFGLSYFVFTFVYYVLDGYNPYGERFIYQSMVDWEDKPVVSLVAAILVSFLVAPLFHLFFFGIYKLKIFIHSRTHQHARKSNFSN